MSTALGRAAEAVAADYLQRQGFRLIAQNWRTRWCEIDIIATRAATIYFMEVKYRRRATWGSGFDYVTPQKLIQMRFAANFWLSTHKVRAPCRLGIISLTGDEPMVEGCLLDV